MVDLDVIHGKVLPCCFDFNRFKFWALNTKLRFQTASQKSVFMRKHIGAENMTVADIIQKLNSGDKPAFLKTIGRYMDTICGLGPFWHKHRIRLLAMVEQLGCGHIFFTLSAADTHWPDLHRLIEEMRALFGEVAQDFNTLTEEQANRRRVQNVIDYPQICAYFLYNGFLLFMDTIKKIPQLEHVDYWC